MTISPYHSGAATASFHAAKATSRNERELEGQRPKGIFFWQVHGPKPPSEVSGY